MWEERLELCGPCLALLVAREVWLASIRSPGCIEEGPSSNTASVVSTMFILVSTHIKHISRQLHVVRRMQVPRWLHAR